MPLSVSGQAGLCPESKADSENNDGGKTRRGQAAAGENDELATDGDFLGVGPEMRYGRAALDGDTTRPGKEQPSRTTCHWLSRRTELPSSVRSAIALKRWMVWPLPVRCRCRPRFLRATQT